MKKDEKLFIEFLNKNLPDMAPTFDEGIGIASERFFMARIIKDIMTKYSIKTVLEAPVDGLMGIPGMNSVYFARLGAKVTIASPSKALLENAQKFWQKLNLIRSVRFVHDPDFRFPFKNKSYDLVWNYCTFERFKDNDLLNQMKKISKNLILLTTQNRYNYGYLIHKLYHQKKKEVWDHGYSDLMDLANLKKICKRNKLKVLQAGVFDIPPWFDTFDMHTRGLGKKFVGDEKKWYWSALQDGDLALLSKNRLIKFLDIFSKIIPPVNYLFAHHFFILASKE